LLKIKKKEKNVPAASTEVDGPDSSNTAVEGPRQEIKSCNEPLCAQLGYCVCQPLLSPKKMKLGNVDLLPVSSPLHKTVPLHDFQSSDCPPPPPLPIMTASGSFERPPSFPPPPPLPVMTSTGVFVKAEGQVNSLCEPTHAVSKKIHWRAMPVHQLQNTLWSDIDNTSTPINLDEFQSLFCSSLDTTSTRKMPTKTDRRQPSSLFLSLDVQRFNNMSIALKPFLKFALFYLFHCLFIYIKAI
jgi:hypothetical protein